MNPTTVRLTTGQALVRWLQAQHSERDGVRRRVIPAMWGIFGHGNALGLGQAIAQEGEQLPLHQPKNEQAMVHAALGFAKATRRLQTFACTASIGPGATNMLTGAATATTNRLPVLLLPADTFAGRHQGPVLQQLEHPISADLTVNDAFRPLSRFFDRIARPEQLLTALPQAMRVLLDPADTGAVTVALHQDTLGEAYDYPVSFFDDHTWIVARRPPAEEELRAGLAVLREAERPLLIAGGGVRHSAAEAALLAFATRLGIPVAETSAGKGSMPADGLLLGGIGVNGTGAANAMARDADVVIHVGTRLTDFTTGSHSLFGDPEVRFLGINVAAADAGKLGATSIVADARLALEALGAELDHGGWRAPFAHADRVTAERTQWSEALEADLQRPALQPLTQGLVYRTVNEAARAGDWVVAAAGWAPGDLLKMWENPEGVSTHLEFGFSCMGHELPAGLGIRMAAGDEGEVFVVIGDGTYLMGNTELVTASQDGLKVTVVLVDNGGYQSINALALGGAGVSVGNEFRSRQGDERVPRGERLAVDYAANAASLGARSWTATTVDELRTALDAARAHEGPAVIVCPADPSRPLLSSAAFWDLGVPEVVATGVPPADAHADASRAQRFYG